MTKMNNQKSNWKTGRIVFLWWVALRNYSQVCLLGELCRTPRLILNVKLRLSFLGWSHFLSGSSEGIVSTCAIARVCLYASLSLTLVVEKSVYLKIFSRVFCMLINFHHLQIYLQTKIVFYLFFILSVSFCHSFSYIHHWFWNKRSTSQVISWRALFTIRLERCLLMAMTTTYSYKN